MMNKVNLGIVALAAMVSFGSVAADTINTARYEPHQVVLTTVGARTGLPTLPGHGSERAVRVDNRAYPVTSVSGRNNMHSTSVVYE
ncbi:hypothetical protein [Sodalis sp. C49]|uniref:hypothetical protein n=1 Tax=unclassified Sodalis (in: enterobacteria) TaxID=2636512 RepID=UPI0039659DCE